MQAAHQAQVDDWTAGHRERSRAGRKHPVEDFIFTYYSLRPSQLRRWHPGARTVLLGDAAAERLSWPWYCEQEGVVDAHVVRGVAVDLQGFLRARSDTLAFVQVLLRRTASRPAQLGCLGLHEWAMVYQLSPGQQRHEDWPLRLGAAGTDAVVEASSLRCSHFDAFRFFTEPARPRNQTQLTRADQPSSEQPGCLHAAMDLYKWAYKLLPAMPSALVARCFVLAREVRLLDMQASPYDLSVLDVAPVRIETPEGRAEYVRRQREFAERSQVLRVELLAECEQWLPALTTLTPDHS